MRNYREPLCKPILEEDVEFVLQKLRQVADLGSFRQEQVLFTGGTGFFGKWLTQTFAALNDRENLGNEYWLVSRDKSRALHESPWLKGRKDFHFIDGDVRHLKFERSFSTIIHGAAAASQSLNEQKPEEMFETIVTGTKAVLAVAERADCKRFQLISSGGVYGPQPPEMPNLSETYLGAPLTTDARSAYGEAKRAAEFFAACAKRRSGFKLSIPRCFAFLGPYLPLHTHFAAGNFLLAVLEGEDIKITGDGTPLRSYLYTADLSVWLIAALLNESPPVLNVGSPEAVSILQLAETVHQESSTSLKNRPRAGLSVGKTTTPGALAARYVPDVECAKKSLGVDVWTPVSLAIRKSLRWYTQNQ